VRVARSADEAERLVAAALAGGGVPATVVRATDGATLPGPIGVRGGDAAGRAQVTGFSLGELRAEVHVDAPEGAWLVYADAYHPGWRAEVNGRPVSVHEADLAFKAVAVPPGASAVRLWFDHGANTLLGHGLALFGALLRRGRAPAELHAGVSPPPRPGDELGA
jgi:hypothetical protein